MASKTRVVAKSKYTNRDSYMVRIPPLKSQILASLAQITTLLFSGMALNGWMKP